MFSLVGESTKHETLRALLGSVRHGCFKPLPPFREKSMLESCFSHHFQAIWSCYTVSLKVRVIIFNFQATTKTYCNSQGSLLRRCCWKLGLLNVILQQFVFGSVNSVLSTSRLLASFLGRSGKDKEGEHNKLIISRFSK